MAIDWHLIDARLTLYWRIQKRCSRGLDNGPTLRLVGSAVVLVPSAICETSVWIDID